MHKKEDIRYAVLVKKAMIKNFLKKDIIQKTIFSYVALMIVPVIIFTCFVNFYCNSRITKTLLSEQQSMADRYVDELDNIMEKISASIDEIKKNKIFYIEFAKDIPVVFLDIRNHIRKVETNLNYGAKVYYYDLYHDEVHTSLGLYKNLNFLQDIVSKHSFIQNNTWILNDKTLNYAVPLERTRNDMLNGVMIFSFENSIFEELFKYTEQYDNVISVVSYNGNPVYSSSNTTVDKINVSKYYHVMSNQNSKTGFEIEHYLPKSSVMKNLYSTIFISAIMIVLMLLVGGVIFLVMMKTSYIPLKRSIWRLVGETNPEPAAEHNFDLLITRMLETKQTLLLNNHIIEKEHFLLKLILGIDKSAAAPEQAKMLGVCLTGPCYACISVKRFQGIEEIELPIALSSEKVSLNDQTLCIIISGGRHILDDALLSLMTANANIDFNVLQIGIGSIESSITALSTSYIHSKVARHKAKQLQQPISRYNDEAEEIGSWKYPYDLLETLDSACNSSDSEKFMAVSQSIQDCILKSPNRFLAACIYHDFFETISHCADALCFVGYDIEKNRKTFYSANPSTKEEMLDIILALTTIFVKHMQESNDKQALSIYAIKSYIAANYQDKNFSLKYLAEHFKTSQSNLSHFFRREAEVTLSEYINDIKIEYAKKLLELPNSNLNTISQSLGFANASTFIRMFKKLEGIPPGEYKKNRNISDE